MSCPEKQILSVMESVTEAVAKAAREESCLTQGELLASATVGVKRGFQKEKRKLMVTSEFEEDLLSTLNVVGKHNSIDVTIGQLFNALQSPTSRTFNDAIANLQHIGLVIVTRTPNEEPLIRLTAPGMDAAGRGRKQA